MRLLKGNQSQTTQPHVHHHYRSITRPAKATDVEIKRRIFNDCTSNGDFEFSAADQQVYSEETNGADAHNRDRVLLMIGTPSGKLPTYPSVKSTLTLTSHLGQNVGLG